MQLDQCLDGAQLFEQFKGVPAIICGAGPSLAKNISVLKQLKDRALIIAGGTAMNALNAYDFLPHFGCGVDPFFTHFTRLVSNQAFEVPYFIRNRMNKDAVAVLHGPKLYLSGATGYPVSAFIDEKLDYAPCEVDEGANVINLSLSIAKRLGCNPILFVGLDLAYTDARSYSPGIAIHGIHDPREELITKRPRDALISAIDVEGKPIYTLMKWVFESFWYSTFAKNFPEIQLFNCTEGGIGFQGVKNIRLQDAANLYLKKQYDIGGQVEHIVHQAESRQAPSISEIKKTIEDLSESLFACHEILQSVQTKNPELYLEKLPKESEHVKEIDEELLQNEAYKHIFKPFDELYRLFMSSEQQGKALPSSVQEYMKGRFHYLHEGVKGNLKHIQQALSEKVVIEHAMHITHPQPLVEKRKAARYELQEDCYVIQDPNIPLEKTAKLVTSTYDPKSASGLKRTLDKNHVLLAEAYYSSGKLHGPSCFYYSNGRLSCRSVFIDGKREGTMKIFDEMGNIRALKGFKDGLEEGLHTYFYLGGKLKSELPYVKGLLEGSVQLYYSNGALMRKVTYHKGKKQGFDILYNAAGKSMLQAEYRHDIPLGTARLWHENGQLAKEIVYFAPGEIYKVKRWDKAGQLIPHESKVDYFDFATKDSMHLSQLIRSMAQTVGGLTKIFSNQFTEAIREELKEDVEALSTQFDQFQEMSRQLFAASGLNGLKPEEAIWKTQAHENKINDFLLTIAAPMQESMIKLHWKLKKMKDSFRGYK